MPSIGIYSWELINEYDVKNLIRVGTAGGISNDLKVRDTIFAIAASTDSNYSHIYDLRGQQPN
jgi:purine-nucleoside phosphorylase